MDRKMSFLFMSAVFSATLFLPSAARTAVPAIYVFGDSTVDVGNNYFVPANKTNANFPPYGIDFPGGEPTGRFTNGFEGIDYFAKKLGFSNSPPAYLSLSKNGKISSGVNFASAGSGILDVTGKGFSIPLNQQIRYFQEIAQRMRSRNGNKSAERSLSKSVFYFSTGSNDIFLFLKVFGLQNETQQALFIELLTNQFKSQLTTLYDLGARKFLVFGTSLIGCVPVFRLFVPRDGCFGYLNDLSLHFNRVTRIALQDLASNLPGFSYSFINVYDFVVHLSSEPLKYGFTEPISACCGSGRLNAESDCTRATKYCSKRNRYIFWDRVHPTQAFYKTINRAAFRGARYASPVTIKQLIRH